MNDSFKHLILQATGGTETVELGKIQNLWSGYGTIKRFAIKDSQIKTIIVKHIHFAKDDMGLQGRNNPRSHQRKLKSYQVETSWYRNWSNQCPNQCYVPQCYATQSQDEQVLIALEDLDGSGYQLRRQTSTIAEIRSCLKWLAHFHATFLGKSPTQLWETGTYWHLETRPDELDALKDKALKNAASALDQKLKSSFYQTFVHGDAKLANFCFSPDGRKVAAVDFQYVGGGCGIKDVAYFISSCLEEEDCEKHQDDFLDYYFQVLTDILRDKRDKAEIDQLASSWRSLYPTAWADFHRFYKGWSPQHWSPNSYSERLTRQAIAEL